VPEQAARRRLRPTASLAALYVVVLTLVAHEGALAFAEVLAQQASRRLLA